MATCATSRQARYNPGMTEAASTPLPRSWQFRLRTLLALMALCGLLFVALREFQDWRRRQQARWQLEQTLEVWDAPAIHAEEIR